MTVSKIRKRLSESKEGWTTKQATDIIIREGGTHH
jgi:hypothetical protein